MFDVAHVAVNCVFFCCCCLKKDNEEETTSKMTGAGE
jgi:hypothetical protein